MKLKIILEPSEEGGYTAFVPSLPGCISEGNTKAEALKNIREVIEMCLEEESEDEVSDIANIREFSFHTVAVEV